MVKSNDVPVWIKIMTTIGGLIIAIWVGGWTASQIYSTNSAVVISLEKRTSATEEGMKLFDKRMDGMEISFVKQQTIQEALIAGQKRIGDQVEKQNELMMKRIEVDARLEQWMKSKDRLSNANN